MKKKIVLIGAGSAQFGLGTVADILQSDILHGSTICLHDINPDSLSMVQAVVRRVVAERKLPYFITATTSRKEALKSADFCILSIEVGGRFKLWEQDWHIPQKYGSRQIYGENGGPGGLFHSLRIIKPVLEIAADINRICSAAYLINFSNPMSRICLAVKRKFPRLRMIGLCHEIGGMKRDLPAILGTPWTNISIKAGGLNHFSVLTEVRYRDTGNDAYPQVRRKASAYFRRRPEYSLIVAILQQFGCLPITSDSHFGEYISWAWDIADHKGIKDFYNRYKKMCFANINMLENIYNGRDKTLWWEKSSGERVIPIIEGILTDSGHEELAVNIPNDGLIDNLPKDLVVEVPAKVNKKGVHGVKLGALPNGIAGLMNQEAAVQDLCVQAAITGSRDLALQALLLDPNTGSYRNAPKILDRMLKLQKKYLSYLK